MKQYTQPFYSFVVFSHPRAVIQWFWAAFAPLPRGFLRSLDACWNTEPPCCASRCHPADTAWCSPTEPSSAWRSTRPSSSAASRSDGSDGAGQRCTSFHCTCRYLWGDAPGVRSRLREPGVSDSGVWPPAGPSRFPPCYRWDWSSHEPKSRSPQLHTDRRLTSTITLYSYFHTDIHSLTSYHVNRMETNWSTLITN